MQKSKNARFCFGRMDIAALAVFLLFAGIIVFAIHTQLCIEDETYHSAVNRRLAEGDRLFVDEWGITQMSHLFCIIPYKIFTGITGSLNGIIVYTRYTYMAVVLLMFWFFYIKLRDRGWGSIIAVMLLCGTPVYNMLLLNYYNIALLGTAVAAVMLFLPVKKQSFPRSFLIGVIFSCAVLCEPGFALVYIFYSLLTLYVHVRSKHGKKEWFDSYSFVLDAKILLGVTAGVAVCFLVFLTFLLSRSGFGNIIDNLPGFFQNKYHFNPQTFVWRLMRRFVALHESFTVTLPALLTVLACAAVILNRKKRLNGALKRVFIFASLALCAAAYAIATFRSVLDDDALFYFQVGMFLPLHICTFILYQLCRNKNRRLFAFWILATACSLAKDPFSLGMICFAGKFSCVPFIFMTRECFAELREEYAGESAGAFRKAAGSKPKKRRSTEYAPAVLTAFLVVCSTVMIGYQYAEGYVRQNRIYPEETERFETIESGPMKGLRAKSTYCRFYESIDRDLDQIGQNCRGPFFAVSVLPYAYLYLDLPIGIYSPYTPFETPVNESERYLLYWQKHPERRPEYLYLLTHSEDPIYDEYFTPSDASFLAYLEDHCDFELTKGNCGDIIHVTNWY